MQAPLSQLHDTTPHGYQYGGGEADATAFTLIPCCSSFFCIIKDNQINIWHQHLHAFSKNLLEAHIFKILKFNIRKSN